MKRWILGVALLSVASVARAEESDDERLNRGEVVVHSEEVAGSKTPRVTAQGVIEVSPATLWRLIDRCGDYARTMIRISASEELSRNGNIVMCRSTVDLPFPLPSLTSTVESVHTVGPGQRYERTWTMIEGPYRDNSGAWILVPYGTSGHQTLLTYVMHADPDLPIPGWVQRMAQRKSIPQLFEKLGELARESDGPRPLK